MGQRKPANAPAVTSLVQTLPIPNPGGITMHAVVGEIDGEKIVEFESYSPGGGDQREPIHAARIKVRLEPAYASALRQMLQEAGY